MNQPMTDPNTRLGFKNPASYLRRLAVAEKNAAVAAAKEAESGKTES